VVLVLAVAAIAGTIEGTVSPGKSVVYVDAVAGKTFPAPSAKPVMDQKGLVFNPHVLVVQQGTTVEFLNSDSVQHNVFWPSISGNKKESHSTRSHSLPDVAEALRHEGGDKVMRRTLFVLSVLAVLTLGCSRKSKQPEALKPTASGAAIAESGGGKQIGSIGMPLDQPLVVQVNDATGSGIAGAAVYFTGPAGVTFTPAAALTDSSGQVTTKVPSASSPGATTS
jgi:plastocyanin